jgi:hypothetical protein
MGSAPSSVKLAPFENEKYRKWVEGRVTAIAKAHGQVPGDWEIWGCSPACWAAIPRATRWFEVHRWEPQQPWFGPEYAQFLRNFKGIVYTGGVVPEIPGHVVYPVDAIEEKFSAYFLTSSLSLMLALAIDTIEKMREQRKISAMQKAGTATEGCVIPGGMSREQFEAELEKNDNDDVIGLWGVDMSAGDEYAYQRPGCQFFVLEALRRGIAVFVPPESDLMRPMPVYGVSEWDHNYIKLTSRARELNQRASQAQAEQRQAEIQVAGLQGEHMALNYFVSTWTCPYGMPVGMILRNDPGSGLGGGITHYDGRPVERMAVAPPVPEAPPPDAMRAMTEAQDAQHGREILALLQPHASENESAAGALDRILNERAAAQAHAQKAEAACQRMALAAKRKAGKKRRG